jgi:hypothetical protein
MPNAPIKSRKIWVLYSLCVLTVAITFVHMQLTQWADNVGFSSNSEYYYSKLHPLRTLLRRVLFWGGLMGGLLCFVALALRGRQVFVQALLVLWAACATYLSCIAGLGAVIAGFAWARGDESIAPLALLVGVLLLLLVSLVAAVRVWRRIQFDLEH